MDFLAEELKHLPSGLRKTVLRVLEREIKKIASSDPSSQTSLSHCATIRATLELVKEVRRDLEQTSRALKEADQG